MHPNTHTLLATTGASPQVITETLFAIHQSNAQWPDALYLITTSFGKDKAVDGLITQGHLQRLCAQLQRPQPAFDTSHVLVAPGADGSPVEDARSVADHEALANFIMTVVRDHTKSGQGSLHASLAGGRKTMTFYIGYALSLFGRPQDMLSHVLVSDGYENVPGFWFPTDDPAHRHIKNRDATLDASVAQVTLAPIPFVRHRRDLPQVLLQNNEGVDFAQLVQLINLGENPDALQLELDLPAGCVRLKATGSQLDLEFRPGTLDLAFYTLMARTTLAGESDLTRPRKGRKDVPFTDCLLDELMPLCELKSGVSREDRMKDLEAVFKGKTHNALEAGITDTWFDQRKNQLGSLFAQQLPDSLVRWLQPSIIWREDGQRLDREAIDKTPKNGGYGIPLQPHQIRIKDMRRR